MAKTSLKDKEHIDLQHLPSHVAIIMDGNGRWAKKRGLPRIVGHEYGVRSVREITEAAAELGVPYLTLYTFSKENWNRPAIEISGLMGLLVRTIRKEINTLIEKNIRLQTIGDIQSLPADVYRELLEAIEKTKNNSRMTLILALNYSARWDILNAVKTAIKNSGEVSPENITEETFKQYLSTKEWPDPEFIIRTSGEFRISNFLLWEAAYAELFFSPVFWPEFSKKHFYDAIADYQNRERRFGKTSEQINEISTK
jgi:undecaprenyl diphosphate synthase